MENVKIKDIKVDKDFMIRDGLDKETVAQYKENLEIITQTNPIVVFDTPDGLLLTDGFHRHAAARQLDWETIPADKRKGSVQDAYAYACIANLKHGKPLNRDERERAIKGYIKIHVRDSDRKIAEEIGAISNVTVGKYRRELESTGELKPQEKRVGKDKRETTAKSSQSDPFNDWFDNHIVCGDTFEELPDDTQKYDLIIVDPPYGITDETWDKKTKFELLTSTRKWLNLVLQKLKPTGRLFVFWSREYMFELKPLFDEIKTDYPLNFGGMIVWNFRNSLTIPNNRKELKITWEPVFYFYGLDAGELNRPDTELSGEKWESIDSDVWTYAIPQSNFSDKKTHPAQKPLELYKHIISITTKPNDLILDPFAGSGTTGHAAYELGREFKLIENSPEYYESIRERLKKVFNGSKEVK